MLGRHICAHKNVFYAQAMAFVEAEVPHRYRLGWPKSASPLLSIVIPTWNGGRQLSATLAHIRDFRAPLDFKTELLIVDDCSEPSTARIAADFAAENEQTVVLTNQTNCSNGHAIARGMLKATGE